MFIVYNSHNMNKTTKATIAILAIIIMLGAGVLIMGSTAWAPDGSDRDNENATSSDSTATTTDDASDIGTPDEPSGEDTAYTPAEDAPQVVAIPEGKHCGEGDPLPSSKADADMDELECMGRALMSCETAYMTDTEQGAYFSVPAQENTGGACEARVKFRHPSEIATLETLRTANGELICSLETLEHFMLESSHRDITLKGADEASYAVRTYYMLFSARADLINKNKNEDAEQILRDNCAGNLVTQTAE